MAVFKKIIIKIVLSIILISIIISFTAIPASFAKLDIGEDEFYYAGTQKGQYTVKDGILKWLLNALADAIDWIIGLVLMAMRAPFVGFTALFERILTWAIQTTSGVDMDNRISNTDFLQTILTSTNNVTVEAIVYNRVPAFDINIFKTDYDSTYSSTGHKYVCDKCKKEVKECTDGDNCTCECEGKCADCSEYMKLNKIINEGEDEEKPVIVQLKKEIAKWYIVIRNLSVAAMLVVLAGIGIKMAISNIASDRALYKRMLVDWVVGILIIFGLILTVSFTIKINEILVDAISEAAEKTHKVNMMQLAQRGGEDAEFSNVDLETSMYEEIRTRAYDPKLVNGIIGMVLYMALVFMAYKYSFIYARRFFTVSILVIMCPAVGVAYGLQKALYGRRPQALKKWISELILNILIQTVHAIIYSVFISTALYLSLESIAGIIVALIVLNFASDAEKIFRKVFNIDPSGKGLLGDTEKAGDFERKYRNLSSLYKSSRSTAKALANTPIANAYKAAARVGVSAGVLTVGGIGKVGKKISEKLPRTTEGTKREEEIDEEMDREGGFGSAYGFGESEEHYEERRAAADQRLDERNEMKASIFRKAKDMVSPIRSSHVKRHTYLELLEIYEKAKKEYEKDPNNEKKAKAYIDASSDLERKIEIGDYNAGGIAKAHIEKVFNIDNYFVLKRKKNGKYTYSLKSGAIFGTKVYNPKTRKMERNNDAIIDQFRAKNLLGFTEQDAKVFKQNVTDNLKNGFIGTAAMFMGMSSFIMYPKLGMGLIAYGAPKKYGSFKKLGYLPNSKKYSGKKYTYRSYTGQTIKNMTNIAVERARFEKDKLVVQNIRERHLKLYKGLKAGTITAVTLSGAYVAGAAGAAIAFGSISSIGSDKISEAEYNINKQQFTQLNNQEKAFREDAFKVMGEEAIINMENTTKSLLEQETKKSYEEMGYEYNSYSDEVTKSVNEQEYMKQEQEKSSIKEDEYNFNDLSGVSSNDVEKEIERILIQIASTEPIDINSEARINQVIKTLDAQLYRKKIINRNESAEKIFKGGRNGLIRVIKRKTTYVNSAIEYANRSFEGIGDQDTKILKETINQTVSGDGSKEAKVGRGATNTPTTMSSNTPTGGTVGNVDISPNFGKDKKQDKKQTKEKNINVQRVSTPINESYIIEETNTIENIIPDGMLESIGMENFENIALGLDFSNVETDKVVEEVMAKVEASFENLEDDKKLSKEQKNTFVKAMTRYIEAIKSIQNNKELVGDENKEIKVKVGEKEKAEVEKKVKAKTNKKMKKLEQIMQIDFNEIEDAANYISNDEELGELDSSKILEMLLIKKDAEETNKLAYEEFKIEKGSKAYVQAMQMEADAETDYYSDLLKVEKFKRDFPELYYADINSDSLTDVQRMQIKEIKDIELRLREKEEKYNQMKRNKEKSGPIVNMNNLLNLSTYID